jgi:hypothetical protein
MAWVTEQVMELVLPFDHVIAQSGLGRHSKNPEITKESV